MSYNLFLDDMRTPKDSYLNLMNEKRYLNENWILAKNYKDFVDVINIKGLPALVSFDHDLSIEHYIDCVNNNVNEDKYNDNNNLEKTGYHCLKWMINYCFERSISIPECLFHTANPVGKNNMLQYYLSAIRSQKEHNSSDNK